MHLKKLILLEVKNKLYNIENANNLKIWKVKVNFILENKIFTYDNIKNISMKMKMFNLKRYFDNDEKKLKDNYLHVIIIPPTGKCLLTFYLLNKKFAVIKYRFGLIFFFHVKADPSQQDTE